EIAMERLELINFYCFKGKNDFNNFRVLIAGGGTGDSTIYLAEQLRNKNAEVVYLDVSESSMAIAKQRAECRGLTNITWLHGSLLNLNDDIGLFDYISCTGVLHHLADPIFGLKCLHHCLAKNGAIGLMLYGQYGRTGVYQMQQLMKLINADEEYLPQKVENTKLTLKELPKTNWFCHNEEFFIDHQNGNDNGLVDLLLHEQDRAYSIIEIYEMLNDTCLNLVEFSCVKMRMSYRPEQYIENPKLLAKIKTQSVMKQQAIAELLVGAFKKHEFYASKEEGTKAEFKDMSNILFFFPQEKYNNLGRELALAMSNNHGKAITMKHISGFEFEVLSSRITWLIFEKIDGKTTLKDIFSKVLKEINDPSVTIEQIAAHFEPIYYQFQKLDWLLLKSE
ncbi:MAG: class I SAM-dependent methyltransferase, partial [Colwellia sp.]|nr:class I SAM-dependent methyltransferase [Colwellia sp.]